MARKTVYRCSRCGYEADVYEGHGFMGQHITMMSCPDCHRLVPLVVGGVVGDSAPSFRSEAGRLCLQCGSNRIRPWDGSTCPRCGGTMQDTDKTEFWT